MFNFSSNEYNKQRTKDRVLEERLRKANKVSTYKSDNDIFGIKANKPLVEGKFYRKTAKEIYESRIDNKFRVISPFFAGQKNDNYISLNLKSNVVFGSEKNKIDPLTNQINFNANVINIKVSQINENNFSQKEGAKSLKSLQKINNCSMSDIFSHSMIDIHEDKYNDIGCFNRVSSAPKLDSTRSRLLAKENEITKSRYNPIQKDNEQNINQINLNDEFDINEYTKNLNENLNYITNFQQDLRRVQSCENIFKSNINNNKLINNQNMGLSINNNVSVNESRNILPISASNHDDLEAIKKSLVFQRINKRDKLTSLASNSYTDLKMLERNINHKNYLQDKNQSQEFFFHKEKRDPKIEKAKQKNEIKDKIIESFVENKIFISDLKPKITNYFDKLKESQIENLRDIHNLQVLKDKYTNKKREIHEYKCELLTQIESKKKLDFLEKSNEKNLMKNHFIQEQEKHQQREIINSHLKESNKNMIIRLNSDLLNIKKKNSIIEREKKLYDLEKERKIRDIYDKELKEIKENNDKYKKLMINILSKQVEEKKKKDIESNLERRNIHGEEIKKKLSFSKI